MYLCSLCYKCLKRIWWITHHAVHQIHMWKTASHVHGDVYFAMSNSFHRWKTASHMYGDVVIFLHTEIWTHMKWPYFHTSCTIHQIWTSDLLILSDMRSSLVGPICQSRSARICSTIVIFFQIINYHICNFRLYHSCERISASYMKILLLACFFSIIFTCYKKLLE